MAEHEQDYQQTVDGDVTTEFLPNTQIEIVRAPQFAKPPQHVLFDFDGTLSLIREGWPEIMVPMMVEILQKTGTEESVEDLQKLAYQFVMELNGKQTIYQMMRLVEEIEKRQGKAEDPLEYKRQYHDRLMEHIESRRSSLRTGEIQPESYLVPGSLELLDGLKQSGAQLYLASGTDENYVKEEVDLLGLSDYFGPHVHGAVDDFRSFSKAQVIERILNEHSIQGESLLGFGDGYVEIQNIKSVGGPAVAVASDESGRSGRSDPWKRQRLIGVGADIVIPDYGHASTLLPYLKFATP